jgi:hypothetical protein
VDVMAKRKLLPLPGTEPRPPSQQPISSLATNSAQHMTGGESERMGKHERHTRFRLVKRMQRPLGDVRIIRNKKDDKYIP